jgi:hypothetical protein
MGIQMQVDGVREVLDELRKYEVETYKRLRTDLIQSAQPAAKAVGRAFPAKPLMNWHRSGGRKGASRLPSYSASAARNTVRVVVSTKKPRRQTEHGLIRLQQMNAGGQVYDSAGSATVGRIGAGSSAGQRFIANLDKRGVKSKGNGFRSRIMYPQTKKNLPLIENAVRDSIRKIDGEVQKRLNG